LHNLNYNKKNNSKVTAATTTIFILAIMTATSIMTTAPGVTATTIITEAGETTTTPSTTSSLGTELSPQPVYQERQTTVRTPINQTHTLFTDSGPGILTLPKATEPIDVTSIDNVVVSINGTAAGKEVLTTLDGSESATLDIYGILRSNTEEGTSRGVVISLAHTSSTGRLAPLDGMIWVGHVELHPDGSSTVTNWEWQSGVSLPSQAVTPTGTTME
jgi:hypothetical protein